MQLSGLSRDNLGSPFAQQLRAGFENLKFEGDLERDFREFFISNSLPRGRLSGLIALVLVIAFICFDLIIGTNGILSTNRILRLGVLLLCPMLVVLISVTFLKTLERRYPQIAAFGITTSGLLVTYLCHIAAVSGEAYMLAGVVLVNLYACLFLGLFFRQAVAISALLVAVHVLFGILFDLRLNELLYSSAMLATVATIGTIASYNLEHALRTNFLETKLLNELAERDGLTGLFNRRIFDDYMRRIWRQARREEMALEIIFVDIDYFKIYNDLYGHQAGDDCLKRVAQSIARCAKRPFDFCARYGGEEFVLVLYGPPVDYGRSVPQQIRKEVMDLAIPHDGSSVASFVTVSVGVSVARPGAGRSLAGAIQAADEALYEAKRFGRNRVVFKDANRSDVETGNFRAFPRDFIDTEVFL
jgi:diguanylate cyclase (GGDEF)-like protein